MRTEIGLVIEREALDEALCVLQRWRGRAPELPEHLRREIAALVALSGEEINEVVRERDRLVIGPSARLLALVANLRAQEAGGL